MKKPRQYVIRMGPSVMHTDGGAVELVKARTFVVQGCNVRLDIGSGIDMLQITDFDDTVVFAAPTSLVCSCVERKKKAKVLPVPADKETEHGRRK